MQRHKRGVFITELGEYFRLSLEPSNEPGGRWTRRGIGAVDRVQPKEAVFVFGNVEPNESTSIDVLVHKRLGHIAPTDTFCEFYDLFEMKQCGFTGLLCSSLGIDVRYRQGRGDHWLKTKSGQISGSESRRVEPMM